MYNNIIMYTANKRHQKCVPTTRNNNIYIYMQ